MPPPQPPPPILIIGAGIAGLTLAQALRAHGLPFRLFERAPDLATRGAGWGLTLHWALPALRAVLPAGVLGRLAEAYVDRAAVEAGRGSRFPFYDLSGGGLVLAVPEAGVRERVRVGRRRLRGVLGWGVEVEWGKSFTRFESHRDSVSVWFEDGSYAEGCLLVGCDGTRSRVRAGLFPTLDTYDIPVRCLGLKVEFTPEQIAPLRELDAFFLQGTASENETYVYFSILDAPENEAGRETYSCQMVFSWPIRDNFFGSPAPIPIPETNGGRLELVQSFASTWAEPFRSLVLGIPDGTDVKPVELVDFAPPRGLRGQGRVVLMGDAFHAMAMYRGEGANHAIVDVQEFVDLVLPQLSRGWGADVQEMAGLRAALDAYEDSVISRTRPAVLASRQACLDAHQWSRIGVRSPLLSRRVMRLDFDDGEPEGVRKPEL